MPIPGKSSNGVPPVISIITPVFNGSAYLDELIQSILNQDYTNFEHIIIDDGSNDNDATINILKKYPHLRWWSRENKGQQYTMNEGIRAAKGSIVSVISSDDLYADKSVFSKVINHFNEKPHLDWLYGKTLTIDDQSRVKEFGPIKRKEPFPTWYIKHSLPIYHCSLFFKKEFIVKHNLYFDESYKYAADWDWVIRLVNFGKFGFIDEILSMYRFHLNQTSQKTQQRILTSEVKRIVKNHQLNKVTYHFLLAKHRLMKVLWIIKNKGLNGLMNDFKVWYEHQ
jgi:glycosyltransferase involved in cell wall biosynthesis